MVVSAKRWWVTGGTLAVVASVSTVVGCSSEHGGDEQSVAEGGTADGSASPRSVQGELLARVDLTKTHYVEFRALPDGGAGVGILEFGQHGESPLDRAEWDALGPEGVYQSLAKRGAPEALLAASREMRETQFRLSDLNTVTEIELPSKPGRISTKTGAAEKLSLSLPVDRSKTIPARANSTSPLHIGATRAADGLGKSTQAVYGDAGWWSTNFCGTSLDVDTDSVWCPTNAGSVTGGTRYTMYYNAAGMSAPGGQGATFRVESYNWTTGAWGTAYSVALAAGQWASYTWQGEVTFRSSITGVNNSAVHFMDKYRRSVTYLTHYTHYPSDIGWDFGNDIQGVATQGTVWYMSRTQQSLTGNYGELTRIPIGTDLRSEPTNVKSQFQAWRNGYDHYGALTLRSGLVYVPMDGSAGCGVGVWSADLVTGRALKTLAAKTAAASNKCGWLAYNPRDGYFYAPREQTGDEKFFKYSIGSSLPHTVTTHGYVTASTGISHISGGSFSPRGVLWLFAGNGTQLKLYAVDIRNGYVYHRSTYTGGADWEAEGVSVFDLSDGRAPGIRGHVHAQLLRNDVFSDDNWWFAHLVASDPAAL